MTSSPDGGRGVSQKMTNDDMMTRGGTTKDENPRNQLLDLPLNNTWDIPASGLGGTLLWSSHETWHFMMFIQRSW